MNTDSAVPGLNRNIALSQEIIIPTEESVVKFNNYCDSFFQKLLENHLQIRSLSRLRDTLLPKLMSGEVRVKL
jgi:type I restriction enzyme, S subunit